MRSLRAIYENGQIIFPEGESPQEEGRVIITFLDDDSGDPSRQKDAGRRFVRRWRGVIKGSNINDWKDQKAKYLEDKSR